MVADPMQREMAPRRRRMHPLAVLGLVVLGMLVGVAGLWGVVVVMQEQRAAYINPHVYVLGVDLGGLTVSQAEERLLEVADRVDAGVATLSDGETEWEAPWRDLGMTIDARSTALAAYVVGHEPADQDPRRWIRLWVGYHAVPPRLGLDVDRTRALLEELAPTLERPASPPSVALEDAEIVVTPGTAGRRLDVEASLEAVLSAAQQGRGEEPILLAFYEVPPATVDPGPLRQAVEAALAPTIDIASYDLLEDRWHNWTLGPDAMVSWLRLEGAEEAGEEPPAVVLDRAAVADTLAGLAAEMGETRGFRTAEAMDAVLAAHAAGGGAVSLAVTYAPREYTVQSGDTALTIAYRHGMPLHAFIQANPGIDLDMLRIGQVVVIPSQDVVTPHPPVPHKRIVISLEEHRLRAYENGEVVYDWLIAAGRKESPTATGVFQVLYTEESAYASLWDLTMPHFIAVYPVAPDFDNGIHALPFLSSGQRLWSGALGTDASYGCIILGVEEAETLFHWVEVGVVVVIEP
ncbi:MAG: L,D-transpeptidase family protein [Chloroflexi bacterium]|nr:L,D-transpeptidase family protein [Chloroflexota bacterium]